MDLPVLFSTAITGLGVAFLHAVIPVHWLPFVAAGRAQGWSRLRTLRVVAMAGTAHVAITALIGVLIAALGAGMDARMEGVFARVAVLILLAFGLWYLYRQWSGKDQHMHARAVESAHVSLDTKPPPGKRNDRVVIGGLVSMLMLAPCETFLPVYLASVPFGWLGFAVLTVTLALATLGTMLAFSAIAWNGLTHLRAGFIERYEAGLIGIMLLLLAGIMWWAA